MIYGKKQYFNKDFDGFQDISPSARVPGPPVKSGHCGGKFTRNEKRRRFPRLHPDFVGGALLRIYIFPLSPAVLSQNAPGLSSARLFH